MYHLQLEACEMQVLYKIEEGLRALFSFSYYDYHKEYNGV